MKRIVLILLLLVSLSEVKSQNSGYNGRHLLITFPLSATLLSQGYGLGLDYTLNRRLSLELLFEQGSSRIFTSTTRYYGYSEILEPAGKLITTTSVPNSRAHFRSFRISLSYFLNSALPAPLGNYLQISYANNIANFNSFYHVVVFGANSSNQYAIPKKVEFLNIPYNSYSLSLGRRRVFYNNISIDLRMSTNIFIYQFDHPEQLTPIGNYGGNLVGYGGYRSVSEQTRYFRGVSAGFSAHLILGLLSL